MYADIFSISLWLVSFCKKMIEKKLQNFALPTSFSFIHLHANNFFGIPTELLIASKKYNVAFGKKKIFTFLLYKTNLLVIKCNATIFKHKKN